MSSFKYKRILLKLSGEALASPSGFGIDVDEAESIAKRIKEVHDTGLEVAVVIGAGNLWRGNRDWNAAWIVPPRIIWGCWQQ